MHSVSHGQGRGGAGCEPWARQGVQGVSHGQGRGAQHISSGHSRDAQGGRSGQGRGAQAMSVMQGRETQGVSTRPQWKDTRYVSSWARQAGRQRMWGSGHIRDAWSSGRNHRLTSAELTIHVKSLQEQTDTSPSSLCLEHSYRHQRRDPSVRPAPGTAQTPLFCWKVWGAFSHSTHEV